LIKIGFWRVFAAALLLSATAGGCTGGSDDRSSTRRGALDPSPFRAEIQALERVLYINSPPEYGDCQAAASLLVELHAAVSSDVGNPTARSRVDEILFLSSYADVGESGYAVPDLKPLRDRWEKIRADVFLPAEWFTAGGPAIDAGQRRPAPKADVRHTHELTRVIERLEELIGDGRDQCEHLGEPEYNVEAPGPRGRTQIGAWNEWSREWAAALDRVAGFLPPQPAWNGERNYSMAYQQVGAAIHELRFVPHGAGVWPTPFAYQWERRFNSAQTAIQTARGHLSRAVRPQPTD
jgi:hypothetical protein